MKQDEFEKRLMSQPLKQMPGEWRAEILSAARKGGSRELTFAATGSRRSWLSTINHQLSTLLWPHPQAWAGLAAVWICIMAVNVSMRDKPPMVAEKMSLPSPEVLAEVRQQQRMLAELIGPMEVRVADRQRLTAPKPRSQRVDILAV